MTAFRIVMIVSGLTVGLFSDLVVAQEIQISWDQQLAFEGDRENYQRLLHGIAAKAAATVSSGLGIRLEKPLKLRVFTRAKYEGEFGSLAAASTGAHYFRGMVNINGGNRLNQRFAGLLEHEISHAFVDYRSTGRALPTWLNEGIAERFRWRRMGMRGLAPNQLNELKQAARQEKLVPLPVRGRLTPYGYLQCYAAVLFIEQKYGPEKLQGLVHQTLKSKSFRLALKQVLNLEVSSLEQEFAEWVSDLE